MKTIQIDKEVFIFRVLSFLDGQMLGSIKNTKEIFESFGTFLAKMNKRLQSCNNIIIEGRIWNWDLQYFHLNKKYINDFILEKYK